MDELKLFKVGYQQYVTLIAVCTMRINNVFHQFYSIGYYDTMRIFSGMRLCTGFNYDFFNDHK